MLEAVVVATIMVSAVAYVATFETPPTASTPTRDNLKQRAQDALDGLYDTPVAGSSMGDNLLSVLLADCMQGDCGDLTSRLDRLLPQGASYAIYMSNGYSTYPILENRTPAGEAITVSHLLEPKWSHSFVTTGTTNVNPAMDSLVTYTLPVFNSNTLSQGGSPLRVIVHGVRTSDGANYTATGFFSTQSIAESDANLHPAVSAYFVRGGVPVAAWDATALTMDAAGIPSGKPVELTLRLNESAGVPVAAGTEVTISLPRGWTGYANQTVNKDAWLILSNATDKNSSYAGSDITARLLGDLAGTTRDLKFNVTFHGDVLQWYPFQARLSKGALAEANLIVRGSRGGNELPPGTLSVKGSDLDAQPPSPDAAYAVPQVGMSVPRPMGATAKTTWTLTVELPDRADESVSFPRSVSLSTRESITDAGEEPEVSSVRPAIVIHSIEIVEQDGVSIFGDVIPVSGKGAWTTAGDRLVWEGSHKSSDGPLGLVFQVEGSGVAGASVAKNPFVPPIAFDAYKSRMLTQVAPGFFRGVMLPSSLDASDEVTTPAAVDGYVPESYPGYATTGYDTNGATPKLGVSHDFTSDSIFKTSLLPGKSNYTLNPVTSFSDSIHGSYVNVDRRNVAVGGTAALTADVQSLLFALSQAGISAGVNLHVYPPWSGDTRDPIWSVENLDSGILGSDVTKMMVLEMNEDGYPDVIVGTSNGRVLALHAITGARLQGGVFTAPLQGGAEDGTVTSITHLLPIRLDGKDYIVVGTDKEGAGIYVLDKNLVPKWSHDKAGHEAVSMDASTDVDGDGRLDILLGTEDGGIYALRALPGTDKLEIYQGEHSDRPSEADLPNAFYTSLGAPTALVGLQGIGPDPALPGLAVTFQSTPGLGATHVDEDPTKSQIGFVTSLPRAGFQGVDATGQATWTFFGSPISVAVATDHDGDKATDIVAGSPAGYVSMMNGLTASQPLHSHLHYAAKTVIDAEAFDPFHMMILTADGQIRITADGWTTATCAYCTTSEADAPTFLVPDAKSIAINGSHSFWLAGKANLLYRSVPGTSVSSPDVNINDPAVPEVEPDTHAPQYPRLAPAYPINTTGIQTNYFASHTHNFNDITFRAVPDNSKGWVVAGPCFNGPECTQSLVMRTEDGGHTWTILKWHDDLALTAWPEGMVMAELTRINFTTETHGWIVGAQGTILRSVDGGLSFQGIRPPNMEEDFIDISCVADDPNRCIAITQASAYVTENALDEADLVEWAPLDLGFSPDNPYTRSLKSVGVVDAEVAYIGAQNMVLKTLDGGLSWSSLPMNYIEADGNRVITFPDGRGYIAGGNVSGGRVFFLHDYALESVAQTKLLEIPEGMVILEAALVADYAIWDGVSAEVQISADGGANWLGMDGPKEPTGVVREEGDLQTFATSYRFETTFYNEIENIGDKPMLRILFHTRGDANLITAQIRNPVLELLLGDPENQEAELVPHSIPIDLTDPTMIDPEATTAAWDAARGILHQPVIQEYWTRNVSGEVKDIVTGYNIDNDWRSEVWVATGGVLAANSPEHVIYAGSDLEKYIKNDNRIYLLDGAKGTVLHRTASFTGNVTGLAMGDGNRDGNPEYLYATVWDPVTSNGSIVSLDPRTLDVHWTVYLGEVFQPSDVVGTSVEGDASAPAVGTRTSDSGQNAIPGKVYSFAGSDGDVNWGAIPDQLGRYVITKDIPPHWLFGPYVVEVEVRWTNDVSYVVDGAPVTKEILQTARFYDYFLVTPPDALSPPSPVYQVHVVTWFDDWR